MSSFIDTWLEPILWLVGDWSLRWGLLIAVLAAWFALRPPRQAAVRLAACQLVLVAGLALPLVPHWWGHDLKLPRRTTDVEEPVIALAATTSIDPVAQPSLAEESTKTLDPVASSTAGLQHDFSVTPAHQTSDIAPSASPALGLRRIVLLLLAGFWCVGAGIRLIQLLAGSIWLSRIRKSAAQPSLQSQAIFDQCRQAMGLRRPVRLGIQSAFPAPVFVGGWHCSILVPNNWEELTPEAQRAILWHELAHVARRDDLSKLAEELIRAVFFFHPLVHWLLNCLDNSREQVCDATAVRRGIAGRTLAQILFDFSRRHPALRAREFAPRQALPFFRRGTVKSRINELLRDESVTSWASPLLRRQFAALAALAATTLIIVGSFGLQAARSQPTSLQLAANDPTPTSPSTPVSPVDRENKEDSKTKPADESRTLDRIFANWKAREERTKSFFFAYDQRLLFGKAAEQRDKGQTPANPADERFELFHVDYWFEGAGRFRSERTFVKSTLPAGAGYLPFSTSVAFDGTLSVTLELTDKSGDPPVAMISEVGPRGRQKQEPDAFSLTFRPFATGWRRDQFHLVTENAILDNFHCTKIQKTYPGGNMVESCWIDPNRNDVIVRWERQYQGKMNSWMSIEYQKDKQFGWVPARFSVGPSGVVSENTVIKFTINQRFVDETFTFKFPPGTIIFDRRTLTRSTVAKDGSRADVLKFESFSEFLIHKLMESKVDFTLDSQPLPEAVDFISKRYNFPIVFDERGFENAGIKTRLQVKSAVPGIKLRELLKHLLAQGPKPIGFKIEDEVLKISPRFANPQPPRAKPFPVAEKAVSPQSKRIQAALDQTVDFSLDPQPLKEALSFIGQRYSIPIVIHTKGFSDAKMEPTLEVKIDAPGIRLRSLLAIILEQCPRPVGFAIEDDVLKISPVFANPRPPRLKPPSSSDVLKMNLAIQKVLDTKTDLNITPQPLRDVIRIIRRRYKIPIVLDEKALANAGIDPRTEVLLDIKGKKLGEALQLLLEQSRPPLRLYLDDGLVRIAPAPAATPPKSAKPADSQKP